MSKTKCCSSFVVQTPTMVYYIHSVIQRLRSFKPKTCMYISMQYGYSAEKLESSINEFQRFPPTFSFTNADILYIRTRTYTASQHFEVWLQHAGPPTSQFRRLPNSLKSDILSGSQTFQNYYRYTYYRYRYLFSLSLRPYIFVQLHVSTCNHIVVQLHEMVLRLQILRNIFGYIWLTRVQLHEMVLRLQILRNIFGYIWLTRVLPRCWCIDSFSILFTAL
jgi:hypothetical protein